MGKYFPDEELVKFMHYHYGDPMAEAVETVLGADPENKTGFANSVRRSLTREIEAEMRGSESWDNV